MENTLADATDKGKLGVGSKFDQWNEVRRESPAIYQPLMPPYLSGLLVIMQYQQGHCRMESHLLGDTPMEEVLQEAPV